MQDVVCVLIERLAEAAGRAKAALNIEESSGGLLNARCRREGMTPSVKCVRQGSSVDGICVSDKHGRMLFVKSGFEVDAFVLV